MIKKATRVKCFIGCLVFVLGMLFSTNFVFAQCGNYLKTNYRAVNKTRNINNSPFQLYDWNGDGKSDFWNMRPNPNGMTADVLIYPTKPSGYWDWDNPIVYTTTLPTSASTGNPSVIKDFNSDGKMDMYARNRIHQNVNNQTLVPLAQVPSGFPDFPMAVFDVNGDNLLDWIYKDGISGQTIIGYYPGTADGAFGAPVTIVNNSDTTQTIVTGDWNGDGKIDILYGMFSAYRILLNNGNGTFSVGSSIQDTHWHFFRKVGDFNNDGRTDVLNTGSSLSGLFIFFGQANGTFIEQEVPHNTPGDLINKIHVAELNADNKLDIILVDTNKYSVHLNDGTGVFTRTDYQQSLVTGGSNLFFEDFSGDGKADLHDNGHDVGFNAVNTFGEEVRAVRQNVCQPFGETRRVNFDVDYEADLVFWNSSTGAWRSKNHNYFGNAATRNFTLGSTGDVPALGDYDGDGKTDYGVFHTGSGDWSIVRSSDGVQVNLHFGLTGDIAVPNDYDGGSKTDVAVFRPSDGNWYILSSETQQVIILHFGLNGDRPVPADYDGDGKTDFAVYRPSEGFWYYYKSSDQSVVIIHWGISTDKPLPADYDGDGKADLAVYRDGDWYILRSESFSFNFIHWGLGTDVPVPMERTGVSGAELIVYRSSNTRWYNHRVQGIFTNFSDEGGVPVYFGLPNN